MKLFEKTLQSREVFQGRIINVTLDEVELENGRKASREVVGHPGGVCVAALTEKMSCCLSGSSVIPITRLCSSCPRANSSLGRTRLKTGSGSFWRRRAP